MDLGRSEKRLSLPCHEVAKNDLSPSLALTRLLALHIKRQLHTRRAQEERVKCLRAC